MTALFHWLTWPLNPQAKPNYFDPPALSTPGGNPLSWEIAVLLSLCVSIVILVRLSAQHWFGLLHSAVVCLIPFFLGLVRTAYMLHRFQNWTGLSPIGETYLTAALFPSYIGVVATIITVVAWFILRLTRSRDAKVI